MVLPYVYFHIQIETSYLNITIILFPQINGQNENFQYNNVYVENKSYILWFELIVHACEKFK